MAENNQQEIDLLFFVQKLNNAFKRGVVLLYNGLLFAKRNWIILLVLILAGVGYGYYAESNAKPSKKAQVLVRINFGAVHDVYSIVANANNEIVSGTFADTGDSEMDKELNRVGAMELTPIINIKEILDKYDSNDRRLEGIVKNLDFEFEEEGEFAALSETFRSEYKYHYLDVSFSHSATTETLEKLIEHINQTPILQETRENGIKSMQEGITSTKETIEQINGVLESYNASEKSSGPQAQLYVVDKNFNISEIFKNKVSLQKQLEDMQRDMVYAKEVVVNVNKPSLYIEEGILSKKMLVYPILLVFIFFGLALMRSAYFSMKRLAEESEVQS